MTKRTQTTKERLEYLRREIKAERISMDEVLELQSLAAYIEPGDVQLLECAGVPEFAEDASIPVEEEGTTLKDATRAGHAALKNPCKQED